MTNLNDLAEQVRSHVANQPWGYWGNDPVPVEIFYRGPESRTPNQEWSVKFVIGLSGNGKSRKWGYASGATLTEALENAHRKQVERDG